MTFLVKALIKLGILKNDLDYHLLRASMVIIFLFFGYQKWFDYEAQALLPYIGHGPLISLDVRSLWRSGGQPHFPRSCRVAVLGRFCSPDIGTKDGGSLGAFGSCFPHSSRPRRSFRLCRTVGAASAGGFPAMTEKVAFLMKDVVLFAVRLSIYCGRT